MKSKTIKKMPVFGVSLALVFSSFLPVFSINDVHAGITDYNGHVTNNRTTFERTETTSENIPFGTDAAAYIAGKKAEWQASVTGQGVNSEYRNGWEALYVADDATNTYKYPAYVGTYFVGVSIDESCGGSGDNAILVGDPDDITSLYGGGCATYIYAVHYQEVTAVPTSFTVKFDTGTVLPNQYKLVDQTVAVGDSISEPTNAEGETLDDFLFYCSTSWDIECYNGYRLEGFYTDPEFNTLYNNNPITKNTTLYAKWVDEYEGYERISLIDFTITPPEVGTVITYDEDGNHWNTQAPQLEASLPSDLRYRLYDDGGYNYAYWLKGSTWEEYEPFAGVIEKGGKYYVEVWFRIKDGELAIFDQNPTIKVNGEVVPTVITDYDIDDIAIMIEVSPKADEESSDINSPNSGAFTATDSATPTISGAAIVSMIILGLAFWSIRTKNEE